MSFKIIVFGNH